MNLALGVLTISLLGTICGLAWAQADRAAGGADKFAEALVYASFANDAFTCRGDSHAADPISEAAKWTGKAIETARAIPENQAGSPVAEFLQRENKTLDGLRKWRNFLAGGSRMIDGMLRRGDLQKAESVVEDPDAPCDRRLADLRKRVREQRQQVTAAIAEGDRFSLAAPRLALRRYLDAQKLDRGDEALEQKIRLLKTP